MFKAFDLFSGVGGMAEGFLQAGFAIPYASDISAQAALTYKNRHKQLGYSVDYFCGDILELAKPNVLISFLGKDFNDIDVICGGPPCQGFSIAGNRDPSDKRNLLIKNYIDILRQIKPKYFVMENVKGILSAYFSEYKGIHKTYKDKKVVDVLKQEFTNINYHVEIKVLDASDFGVPQQRLRVIFLGTRNDQQNRLVHPEPIFYNKISAQDAISDLEDICIGETQTVYSKKNISNYQMESRKGRTLTAKGIPLSSIEIFNHQTSKHSEKTVKRFSLLKEGESLNELFERLDDKNKDIFFTKKHSCKRMESNKPSFTVLTLPDDMIHYSKNRILTVREMARLQSFDDSFEFLGKRTTGGKQRISETPQYTLVGNAVPPLLAKAIADQILKVLKE